MKTLFLFIVAIFAITFPSLAHARNTVETDTNLVEQFPSPTTQQLVEKFGDKLDQYIDALASKAGVAAQHFYPIFVRHQQIVGIFDLSLMVLGLIVGGYFFRRMFKHIRNWGNISKDHDRERHESEVNQSVITGIIGIILLLVTIINICISGDTAISQTFNPEYHAVQDLVKMVK